ncbi:MAG TPA: DUF1592 domain-containing protein [Planctomycetota bacterium]|nr:DUF1592 domain-containing protein [Planctomycetota bacterium]
MIHMRILSICLAAFAPFAALCSDTPTYSKDGFPFLEKHCTECHGDKVKKSGLTFLPYKDEAAVLKDRAIWKTALTMVVSGEMPPDKKPRPNPDEIAAFTRAVSTVFQTGDRNAKTDAGSVAMHRLNRAEYNNTVRDLVNLDFNPAEDFPADEVGHGFDNISDVQWISPVHMERYLAAAESIAQRVIILDPPKAPHRQQSGQFLEPAGRDVPKDKYRHISADKPDNPIATGPLHTPYRTNPESEYIFKAKLYAIPNEPKPAVAKSASFFQFVDLKKLTAALDSKTFDKTIRVAMLGCGANVPNPATDAEAAQLFGVAVKNLRPFQILKIVEIKGRGVYGSDFIEAKIPKNFGLQRVALAIVKPADGGPIPHVYVEWLGLDGPLDTRTSFQKKYLTCPDGTPRAQFTRDFLAKFIARAFRRPAKPDEIERYTKIVDSVVTAGDKWEAGVQQAIQIILSSPKFIFRPELENGGVGAGNQPISEFELASRLSYFLWSSMPDEELLALAEKNELSANLDAQVRRMLKDPKSRALTENFALQWLQLRRLNNSAPDPKLFAFFARLRPAMLEESTLFLDAIIHEDRSILDIIDGNFTFLNDTLARHYGMVDTAGNLKGEKTPRPGGKPIGFQFQRVELGEKSQRGGLLTQASFLTVTSNPTRTSPVKRGRWVLDQLLGTPPPPPPPDVPALDNAKELTGTLRQRMEQHRADPNCAACHARMDPIGFAFENYDAIGAYRSQDAGQNIDASGELPGGQKFDGPSGLKEVLKKKKDLFCRCMAEKMMTYALGRGIEVYDSGSITRIVDALAKDNYRFSTLAVEIAKSDQFRMRKAKE